MLAEGRSLKTERGIRTEPGTSVRGPRVTSKGDPGEERRHEPGKVPKHGEGHEGGTRGPCGHSVQRNRLPSKVSASAPRPWGDRGKGQRPAPGSLVDETALWPLAPVATTSAALKAPAYAGDRRHHFRGVGQPARRAVLSPVF
jgi:hypothetical protein